MKCSICNSETQVLIKLSSKQNSSITSLGKILSASASIYFCKQCAHCQTFPSINLEEYYSNEYKTLSNSSDEDDLYTITNGKPIYRNEYMISTLLKKLQKYTNVNKGAVLDFGCGKSLSMKHYKRLTNNKDVYLYDVSEDYLQFWETFLPRSHVSVFELPEKWSEKFNLVTSFFSFEHVSDPIDELKKIRSVIKNSGLLYIVVPNMYSANVADMIVIDHIQHFSESSMGRLLKTGGFSLIEADHQSHAQASIYIAKPGTHTNKTVQVDSEVEKTLNHCKQIAASWQKINKSIQNFEKILQEKSIYNYYIVGAGIIGTYIYIQLNNPDRVLGFIDSNKFKQEKGWQKLKVFPPKTIDGNSSTAVFSGLNKEQIDTLLPGMIPLSIPQKNIWSLKNAE